MTAIKDTRSAVQVARNRRNVSKNAASAAPVVGTVQAGGEEAVPNEELDCKAFPHSMNVSDAEADLIAAIRAGGKWGPLIFNDPDFQADAAGQGITAETIAREHAEYAASLEKVKTAAALAVQGDIPGARDCGWIEEDVSEMEAALLATLREGLRCETSWQAYWERDVWQLLKMMVAGIRDGDSIEKLMRICDDNQFAYLYPAAIATANALNTIVAGYRATHEKHQSEKATP